MLTRQGQVSIGMNYKAPPLCKIHVEDQEQEIKLKLNQYINQQSHEHTIISS